MKFLVMEWKGWESPVTILGDVEAATLGAAIRAGASRWRQLRADNYFIKERDWTPYCVPDRVRPLPSAPPDNPYG